MDTNSPENSNYWWCAWVFLTVLLPVFGQEVKQVDFGLAPAFDLQAHSSIKPFSVYVARQGPNVRADIGLKFFIVSRNSVAILNHDTISMRLTNDDHEFKPVITGRHVKKANRFDYFDLYPGEELQEKLNGVLVLENNMIFLKYYNKAGVEYSFGPLETGVYRINLVYEVMSVSRKVLQEKVGRGELHGEVLGPIKSDPFLINIIQ